MKSLSWPHGGKLFFPAILTLVLPSSSSRLRLLIDDQTLKSNQRLQDLSGSQHPLYLGGSHFEGCISNVFIRRCVPSSGCVADERGLPPGRASPCSGGGAGFVTMCCTRQSFLQPPNAFLDKIHTLETNHLPQTRAWAQPPFVGAGVAHNLGKGLVKVNFQIMSLKISHTEILHHFNQGHAV